MCKGVYGTDGIQGAESERARIGHNGLVQPPSLHGSTVPPMLWDDQTGDRTVADKLAVVSGAASGIGRATAVRLARAGVSVVLLDRNLPEPAVQAIGDEGGTATGRVADVSDEAAVTALFQDLAKDHGRLDILVCAAGINIRRELPDMTGAEWDNLLAVNLKGVFLCCRAAIPLMRSGGGGSIVTVASDLGLVAARRAAAYGASKGGVIQLTRGIALDHARDGIRANCVCPGPVDTPMLRGGYETEAAMREALQRAAGHTILGRLGHPEEIANVIAFLASEEASFMTGAVVPVDGGITAV